MGTFYIVDEDNRIVDKGSNMLEMRIDCKKMNDRIGGHCEVVSHLELTRRLSSSTISIEDHVNALKKMKCDGLSDDQISLQLASIGLSSDELTEVLGRFEKEFQNETSENLLFKASNSVEELQGDISINAKISIR